MDITAKSVDIVKLSTPCLVVGVRAGKRPRLSAAATQLDKATSKRLSQVIATGDLGSSPGTTVMLYDLPGIGASRLMLVGLGKAGKISDARMRIVLGAVVKTLRGHHIRSADISLNEVLSDSKIAKRRARLAAETVIDVMYHYQETKSGRKKAQLPSRLSFLVDREQLKDARQGVTQGKAIANGVSFAKTLSNLPGNVCTPSYLARQARGLQKSHGLKVTVLDEAAMKRHKMGSLLSVSRGSREPAKLILMEYKGGERGEKPVVLVGKGLTFDAGGISIKPAAAMDEMKFDMCGGASVFGTVIAAAEMRLKLNLVGIVPSSENLPDGAANKPGDIVTAMDGTTIEILNTDAEGRLILCDALTYARRYKPAVVVDIATLTGACVIALGHHASGLFSNNDRLARDLLAAGESSGDRAWRMPLWEDYSKQLKSNFADLANIGGRSAGAVTAGCFLKHFVDGLDWAHLDIAGTAWKSGGDKGATGRPVPLLTEYLMERCDAT